jgi:integrase
MPLKKQTFKEDEIAIYDDAVILKRGDYWQFRMWLTDEHKYARFSLKTRNKSTAIDKAKLHYHELMAQQLAGKKYFSLTTKLGVEAYLQQRSKDVDAKAIVKGRLSTITTHLQHWLNFIGRDIKLKELERTDCENYYAARTKTKKGVAISQSTVLNEQSTINACMLWLFKRGETYIDGFDFKRLTKIDRGDEAIRRSLFTLDEIESIRVALESEINEAKANVDEESNLKKIVVCYYLLISIITGMRRGEALQLMWSNITFEEKNIKDKDDETESLVRIYLPYTITKIKKTRIVYFNDKEYFIDLQNLLLRNYKILTGKMAGFSETLVFSANTKTAISHRTITYWFENIIEKAGIQNLDKRNIVPYSFRHSFITHMINRGYDERRVADMCGTSRAEIEKTYYHITDKKMIENALPDYQYENGILIPRVR